MPTIDQVAGMTMAATSMSISRCVFYFDVSSTEAPTIARVVPMMARYGAVRPIHPVYFGGKHVLLVEAGNFS